MALTVVYVAISGVVLTSTQGANIQVDLVTQID